MRRLGLVLAMVLSLVAMVLATDSSGVLVDNAGEDAAVTVDDTHNTTVVQPAADFIPRPNDNDDAAEKSPSDGNGGGLSRLVVAVIVSVSVAGLLLGLTLVGFAWRALRREEESMLMDLGDDRNYVYGQFGDYAAM